MKMSSLIRIIPHPWRGNHCYQLLWNDLHLLSPAQMLFNLALKRLQTVWAWIIPVYNGNRITLMVCNGNITNQLIIQVSLSLQYVESGPLSDMEFMPKIVMEQCFYDLQVKYRPLGVLWKAMKLYIWKQIFSILF